MSEPGIIPWQADSAIVPAEAVDDMRAMGRRWNSVPLVRCRDCAHFATDGILFLCNHFAIGHWDAEREADIVSRCEVTPDGYCAWAVRRS